MGARRQRTKSRQPNSIFSVAAIAPPWIRSSMKSPPSDSMAQHKSGQMLSAGSSTSTTGSCLTPASARNEENQWELDRDNRSAVRSNDAARTAARILVQSLGQYQGEQYGQTDNGTPRAPPSVEHFSAWTTKGQEKKRQKRLEETVRRWRSVIAPDLLRQIRQAIIPLEVQIRRQLAQHRLTEKRTAEAQRRRIAAVQTPTSSRSRPRD